MGEIRMVNIDYIMELLDWNNSNEEQLYGIKLAQEVKCINAFLQPGIPYGKSVWDNCAKILCEKSDIVLAPYLGDLLEWLQDLNWPGALIILDRLKIFSGEKLKRPFIDLVTYATNLNNEEGLMWLDNLSELLDNEELKEELPKPIVEKLQKHYKNWGFWYDE